VSLRFGTDGVRGVAGSELTPELVLNLGRAAARVLAVPGRPLVVGRDTRLSGPLLQAAFSAGVAAEGIDVVDLGVLPTPAVAAASLDRGAPAAIISASHNLFADNGIKLLSAGGRKLTDDEEAAVEGHLAAGPHAAGGAPRSGAPRSGAALGRMTADPGFVDRYCRLVASALPGRDLGGLRVAIDCGNGAASATAARILEAAGADLVAVLSARPDGTNINAGCGSTDPGPLGAAVRETGAVAGLAFDGDADRVIAVDEHGSVVDGDRLLALFAADLLAAGRLAGPGVAVTVMTNLGFHHAMAALGVEVASTPVGDRHILEAVEARDWTLGGEQSGHIIFRGLFPALAPTGDGVLTGLLLLDLLARNGGALSEMAGAAMDRLPQVLVNVRVADHRALAGAAAVWDEVQSIESQLGGDGRVLLRPSGTEPLVRVMVEAPNQASAEDAAERLARVVVESLGAAGA
jgi:phosphoglucosamine mutase